MAKKPHITPEMQRLLERYLELHSQEALLKKLRGELRTVLDNYLASMELSRLLPEADKQKEKALFDHRLTLDYPANVLRGLLKDSDPSVFLSDSRGPDGPESEALHVFNPILNIVPPVRVEGVEEIIGGEASDLVRRTMGVLKIVE